MSDGVPGFVHSWELAAGLDGPGWRFLLFTAGCPLRCGFCHNPDTWRADQGERTDSALVAAELAKVAPLLRQAGGGVTLSGGEPLAQMRFTADILARARQMGLSTAIETTGACGAIETTGACGAIETTGACRARAADALWPALDLVMLDLKAGTEATYRRLTGRDMAASRDFARQVSARGIPLWLRFVLIPGATDDPAEWEALARLALGLDGVERVEVLPFHQMGAAKWRDLGRPYPFADTPAADPERVAAAVAYLRGCGLNAV